MNLEEVLSISKQNGCSDVHLTTDFPIIARKNGKLFVAEDAKLDAESLERAISSLLSVENQQLFKQGKDVDAAYEDRFGQRYRLNAYHSSGKPACAIRILSDKIPTLLGLSLPSVVASLADLPQGLVLVTGPTGSGKTTTLAAMIDHINQKRNAHIITIEDPIEYAFTPKKCLIHQREIHRDVEDFGSALRSALREDPDVIMVGEMRDLETISLAITAAETGQLVLSTLHTSSAPSTIDRIINVFEASKQQEIRQELSSVLAGILCQRLIPTADGIGRKAAMEILINNEATKNLIRDGKNAQLAAIMEMSSGIGMQLMDQNLAFLVQQGTITQEEALKACHQVTAFKRYLIQG